MSDTKPYTVDCLDHDSWSIVRDGKMVLCSIPTKTHAEEICSALNSAFAQGLAAAATGEGIPKGHILTDDGAVRKVLGTLRYTKDGAVVQRGDWVFSSGSGYCVTDRYTVPLCVLNDTKDGYRDLNVEECYSDREAARADRDPSRAALKRGGGGEVMKPGTIVRHVVTDTEHDKHVGIVIAVDTSERLDGATTVDIWVRWIKPDGSPSDGLIRHAPAELTTNPPANGQGDSR